MDYFILQQTFEADAIFSCLRYKQEKWTLAKSHSYITKDIYSTLGLVISDFIYYFLIFHNFNLWR